MPMTNAERQRRYRERAYRDPHGHLLTRVTLSLGPSPAAALKRLAHGYGITQRELIEKLLMEAEQATRGRLDQADLDAYVDGCLPPGALCSNDTDTTTNEPLRHNDTPRPKGSPVGAGGNPSLFHVE